MRTFDLLILTCAIGSGLVAGVFFAFSTAVMKALGKLPPSHGIAAMQAINVVILNPLFLGVFLGTAFACAGAGVTCFLQPEQPERGWVLSGALTYLVGSFLVTIGFNVPRNERLARVGAADPQAIAVWQDYLRTWTAWNHVRTVASMAAAASFVLAGLDR